MDIRLIPGPFVLDSRDWTFGQTEKKEAGSFELRLSNQQATEEPSPGQLSVKLTPINTLGWHIDHAEIKNVICKPQTMALVKTAAR